MSCTIQLIILRALSKRVSVCDLVQTGIQTQTHTLTPEIKHLWIYGHFHQYLEMEHVVMVCWV